MSLYLLCRVVLKNKWECKLPPKNCHSPFASTRIRSLAAVVADLQHILKRLQGGDQGCGTLRSGKNWQNRLSDRSVQEKILWVPILASSHIMVKSALAIKEKFTIKSQNRVAMVQISWEITRWCCGCAFRSELLVFQAGAVLCPILTGRYHSHCCLVP